MSSLANQQQNLSFPGLLQVPGGITSTLQQVQDGDGNVTGLSLSSAGASVTTSSTFQASKNGTTIVGAIPRLISDGFGDVINAKDFGATGDGITDDTAAINLAIAATTSGKALFFPAGNYLFTSALTFSADNICIYGAGSFQTVLTYGGASATNNIISIDNGTTQIVNYVIHGIRIMSNTTMTAGFAVYAKGLCRSFIYDFSIGSSEIASPKVWSGIWFDSTDNVYLSNYQINPQNIGLLVNGAIGALPKAGLFVNLGRIAGGVTGVHVAGAFGGIYIDQSDIIAMTGDGVLIDNAIVAEGNREVFLGSTLSIDSVGGNGVNINDTIGTNQTIKLSGTWVASCTNHGVYVQAASNAAVIIDGCRIFNHTNDGIRSNTASGATVVVDSCSIASCGGYGVNGTSSGNTQLLLGSNAFQSCTLGNTNYVSPLPMVDAQITKATSGSKLQIANLASGILNAQQISNIAYNQTRSSDTDYNAGGTLFVGVSQNGQVGLAANMWNSTSGYLGASFIGFSGYTASSNYQGDIRFFTKYNGATTEKVRVDPLGNAYIEAGTLWQYAPTPTSISTTTSLAAVVLTTGIINTTGTSYTVTLPLASDIDVVYAYAPTTNIGFDFHVVNTASGTITIAVNTGITSLGALTVSTLTSATFRLRRTAASTYQLIRLS
jgi:hypothetical protein